MLLSHNGFESDCPETKFETITSWSQFEKVTVQKSIAELWIVVSNQMIKYQLSHTRFNQLSYHKHNIYLCGKPSTKLLAQVANKNAKFMFAKTGRLLFS